MSGATFLKIGVAGSVGVAVLATWMIVNAAQRGEEQRQAGEAELITLIDSTIAEAEGFAADFDFPSALSKLDELHDPIQRSSYSNFSLTQRVENAIHRLKQAEAEYHEKTGQGYVVFEGRFVSPDEKALIVAENKRLEEAEQRLAGERLIAEEAERRQQEREKELAQARRELGSWTTSHRLKSGIVKRIGDVDVALGYRFSTVYAPQSALTVRSTTPHFGVFFPVAYRKSGGQFNEPTAGFIPVHGTPEKVTLASSDTSMVKVYDDGSAFFWGSSAESVGGR